MSHRIVGLERQCPGNPLAGTIKLADFDQRTGTEFGCFGVIGMQGELTFRQFGTFTCSLFGILRSS